MAKEKRKLKVYCETSFWGFLNGRPTPLSHIAVKQSATLQWWQEIAPQCLLFVSQHVDAEGADGDPEMAKLRKAHIDEVPLLDGTLPEIVDLADRLMKAHAVPASEGTDALHIATAAYYHMDVLLTLNCKHMANPVTLPKTVEVVTKAGYHAPIIITPGDFLDRREEFEL